MPTRRQALAVGSSSVVALLAGCSALGGEQELGENDKEFLEGYRDAYEHNQQGRESLGAGFTAYDNGNMATAATEFDVAIDEFRESEDIAKDIQFADIESEYPEEAAEGLSTARITASLAADTLDDNFNIQGMSFLEEERVASVRADLEAGRLEMVSPDVIEEEMRQN